MAELKTKQTKESVAAFLAKVEPEGRRKDAKAVAKLMERLTGDKPSMWGASMVGFGRYRYTYESGRQGEWFMIGFSPRKANLTIYLIDGFSGADDLRAKLGKHKVGKSCLYVNSLADLDLGVLEDMLKRSVAHMRAKYPE